jgi:hypothetical protein
MGGQVRGKEADMRMRIVVFIVVSWGLAPMAVASEAKYDPNSAGAGGHIYVVPRNQEQKVREENSSPSDEKAGITETRWTVRKASYGSADTSGEPPRNLGKIIGPRPEKTPLSRVLREDAGRATVKPTPPAPGTDFADLLLATTAAPAPPQGPPPSVIPTTEGAVGGVYALVLVIGGILFLGGAGELIRWSWPRTRNWREKETWRKILLDLRAALRPHRRRIILVAAGVLGVVFLLRTR